MSLAPSSSSSRGDVVLQPAYFTSSAFVHPARADVDRLIREYVQQYARSAESRRRPFTLFKEVWQALGWTWIHFKVFDARARAAFLRVVMRLFLERVDEGDPLNRVAAMFGLYTMFRTQPSTSTPTLYCAVRVQVTCDLYDAILTLPDVLDEEFLLPVRPHAIYVRSDLLQAGIFQILPQMQPLPREIVVQEGEGRKKRGRLSKHERIKKARDCLAALEILCDGGYSGDVDAWRGEYMQTKSAFVTAVDGDALREAEGVVAERLGELDRL